MSYTYTDKIKFEYTPNFDSFGRFRTSTPLTLFDSSHRYRDNGHWATYVTGSATASFDPSTAHINLHLGTSSNSECIRETYKVFAYQPGKSLLTLNTFVMAGTSSNLRQRVGYFGVDNGFYFEQDDFNYFFVKRTSVTGAVVETGITQSNWNVDTMNGTGPSGVNIDFTKTQILWMDFEWLGVGSVRCGFIINGEFCTCHVFHHANNLSTTYMTTACLPLRYEIKNKSSQITGHTFSQICSTVLSEGGYELRGFSRTINTPITSAYTMTTAGTYYPIVSIRLKSTNLDGIVIPRGFSLLPDSTAKLNFKIFRNGTTTGGTWSSSGDDSVEYNITGTAFSGGTDVFSGFLVSTNQSQTSLNTLGDDIFQYQLLRNSFTNSPQEFTLCVASDGNGDTIFGSLDWQEITK